MPVRDRVATAVKQRSGGRMLSDAQLKLIDLYNEALGLYKQRKWTDARNAFLKALEVVPDDGPTKLYLTRCDEYLKNPPDDDWDGVFVMKTK